MKGDKGFFTRLGFDVLKNLVFIVNEAVAIFMWSVLECWHGMSPVCCGLRQEAGLTALLKQT
jgi:hypothetical protein